MIGCLCISPKIDLKIQDQFYKSKKNQNIFNSQIQTIQTIELLNFITFEYVDI